MDVCRTFARRRWSRAVLGAAGLAASVVSAADAPRAVVLLPPRVGEPAPAPVVARAAPDDDPLATTPVVRKNASPQLRPLSPGAAPAVTPASGGGGKGLDWLSGVDPNVLPAGGTVPRTPTTEPASPASAKLAPPTEPGPLAKGVDAVKGFVAPSAAPPGTPPLSPAARPQQPAPAPGDPLQGKAANGAPVLAGPPAWRWYGYGTVTPGANPFAPSGQYPRASSNWYEVTRATPGAFPVPVVNPFRTTPGAEPPAYATAPPAPRPTPAAAVPTPADLAGAPRFTPPPVPTPTFMPPPLSVAPPAFAPVPVPTADPPPAFALPAPVSVAPPQQQVPVPTLAPIPLPPPVAVAPPAFAPIPLPAPVSLAPDAAPARLPEPLTTAPPVEEPAAGPRLGAAPGPLPSIPTAGPVVPPQVPVVAPAAAPVVPDDDTPWRANPDRPAAPPAGTWLPADRARPAAGPGAFAAPRGVVARAQAPDEPAAGPASVVEAVCRGRARNVDVRASGPRRLTVCFEVRGQPDAAALVRDLSARPELARYEIDFCVVVR